MTDSEVGKSDSLNSAQSSWNREPDLVSLEIASWEHAAVVPGSWGKAERVADLQRLLPHELTEPIYRLMAKAEALFLKRTEPLPPFRERLARDFLERAERPELPAHATADTSDSLTLDGELNNLLPRRLADVVPSWDEELDRVLGADTAGIAHKIRNFASLGPPRADFSFQYGYRVQIRHLSGNLLGPTFSTHSALLMGCVAPYYQPGLLRELHDLLCG